MTGRKEDLVEPTGDAALEEFLLRVHDLGTGPAPAPNARLAAVLGAPAPARVRRLAPRTVAGATALGVATLLGTGWAAAAADQLPAPAQRAVARLTAGWLPGIPHPEDQRTGAGTTPSAVLPAPTTTTVPAPSEEPTGDGTRPPVRQSVAPRPSGTRSEDTEGSDGGGREGAGSQDRTGEDGESGSPSPSGTRATSDDSRDDSGTGDGSQAGSTESSTSGTGDGATDTQDDGDGTGSGDEHDGSGTGSGGLDSHG